MTPPNYADGASQNPGSSTRRRSLVLIIWAAILCLTCGLLYPVVVVERDGEAYVESAVNLRQIGLALLNYHEAYGSRLPPAADRDKDGRPLLSWRVLLLPYLEHDGLYKQFKLDEPWDGPHNKALLEKMPRTYAKGFFGSREQPYATHYQVFVGIGTAFERDGLSLADFADGPANTLLVVEAAEAVPWTKPDDLAYAPDRPLPRLGLGFTKPVKFLGRELRRKPGFNAVFADGTVRFLDAGTDESTRRALITRNGGEAVDVSKVD